MPVAIRPLAAALALTLCAAAAAQEQDAQDSAILPNAEGHERSEAESMEVNCEEEPEECVGEDLPTGAEGGANQSSTATEPATEVDAAPEQD